MQDPSPAGPPQKTEAPKKLTLWQKFGAGSLSISILFHLVLLAIGIFWVLQVLPPPEKKVDFLPPSGGGGSPAAESQAKKHQVRMTQPSLSRVAAVGASSSLVLPEPDALTEMNSLGSLASGGLSKGLGGDGSGGGKGSGTGTGFGNGMGAGLSNGNGSMNPFGMVSPADKAALQGTFYDFKQTDKGQPTEMTDDQFREEIHKIVRGGMKESAFRRYFKAPRELYQTKLHIPLMTADAAPAAFEVQKEVQPRRWVVVYRGAVQAPKTGKFRFVGAGDDLLLVRLNGRVLFDYGYTMATIGTNVVFKHGVLAGTRQDDELEKKLRRDSPMRSPVTFYKYSTTPQQNDHIGGMAVGPEFSVEAGRTYPVEILIGEIPGGHFSVSLLIEEAGATYQKDSTGSPILPLFRLDSQPPAPLEGQAPPYSPDGPVWKSVPGGGRRDI
ncbi:MAG: hypothetical protein EOP88_18335 [Verrucomicrobiaceae bacterium]|nr:MAG: hypothetical protein EOP88_18335 [Verrucomicrobiaceae bacterium]